MRLGEQRNLVWKRGIEKERKQEEKQKEKEKEDGIPDALEYFFHVVIFWIADPGPFQEPCLNKILPGISMID